MPDIGYGVQLSVSDAFPATTPTNTVGQITSFVPPNPTRDVIDVTNASSPNMAREFIVGLIDFGESTFELNWDLSSTSDVLLRGLFTERTTRTWRATFTQYSPARTLTFTAYMTGYERNIPMEDKMSATVTLKVTGAPVFA